MRSTATPEAESVSSIATRAAWSRPALAPGVNTTPATARERRGDFEDGGDMVPILVRRTGPCHGQGAF
jgi:hypothetical protein